MAINGSRSNFTKTNNYALDTFKEMFNLSASDVSLVKEWKELKSKFNRNDEDNSRLVELNNLLSGRIVTSEDWNKLLDAMYNLEQAYVDKGLDRVEALEEVVDSLTSTSTVNPLSANQGKILNEKDIGLKYKGSTNGEIFNNYTDNIASGQYSHSEGNNTSAIGNFSHAEGNSTTALGSNSYASGGSTSKAKNIITDLSTSTANDTIITAWESNKFSLAKGDYSSVSGLDCLALDSYAHAEGRQTIAQELYSHAEGFRTKASGNHSHSEGFDTVASGSTSHAEGNNTTASGVCSHSEGYSTEAIGEDSHAEGSYTTADGVCSHAEGNNTTASGNASHAGGSTSTASGLFSFAHGFNAQAKGEGSFAVGVSTESDGNYSFSANYCTKAARYQSVFGKMNIYKGGATSNDDQSADASLFIVGNGTSATGSNAFRITADGQCRGTSAFVSSGADYAEYFEWLDGNPNDEDRRGKFVTLVGDKIRIANYSDEFILGVVSGTGAFIGNSASEDWQGKYLKDVFGKPLTQQVKVPETYDEITKEVIPAHTVTKFVLNPDYDPKQEYIGREFRQEWSPIGLLGKIVVNDNGKCQVNGYCCVDDDGVAIPSENGYRVMKRIDDNHISILFK